MSEQKIMGWVEKLTNVSGSILEERKAIEEKSHQAAQLQWQSEKLRQEAYFEAIKLEGKIRTKWSDSEISQAKNA